MRPDRTDYLTWAAALIISLALGAILVSRPAAGPGPEGRQPGAPSREADREAADLGRALGHFPAREGDGQALAAFLEREPGNSRGHFARAELAWREGDLAAAASGFRRALQLNRSYLDRTSPVFAGEGLRRFSDDGLRVFLREKELRPDDEQVREAIKDLYFIKRALAGGCD